MQPAQNTLKILVNPHEVTTHDRLAEVCRANNAHLCPKVRVKDALPLEGSGVSTEEYSFALRSHFDFIIADADWRPLFAVEFDGSCHQTLDARRRDNLKNGLCERFHLPLLRVNANYLVMRFRQWDLLSYLTEVWLLRDSFFEAQNAGHVPLDEPFDPCM